jgi:CubicO group peptidase (beta-lactamase class C family)
MLTDKLKEELKKYGLHACLINQQDERIFTYVKEGKENNHEVLNSVSKSVLGLLIGIALDEGLMTLKTKTSDLISVHHSVQNRTVEDLLTMQSGYSEKEWNKVIQSENWGNTVQKMKAEKEGMTYNSFDSYLLILMLAEASGRNPADLAEEKLFEPLGITGWQWDRSTENYPIGGYGLKTSAEDLMKIGELVLHKGKWNGKQIVSEKWIESMMNPHVKNAVRGQSYGYHWWITADTPPVYYAAGREGKFLFIMPEKQLSAVFIGELPKQDLLPFQWFMKYVYPGD